MNSETLKPDDLIVKSLTALIRDVGNQFQVSMHYQNLDIQTMKNRLKYEGVGFATKTLPKLGKHFDNALKEGKFPSMGDFKKRPRSALPSFLQGLTRKVFALDGTLLDSPDVDAIRVIRQITMIFYKLEADYPKELVDEVIRGFTKVDEDLADVNPFDHRHYFYAFSASKIVRRIFAGFRHRDIIPRPGPGVTADKRDHSERYEPHVKYMDLHNVYPYSQYFFANMRSLIPKLEVYKQLPVEKSGCSRLALVPKDSRGPRIICTEPHEYMWLQQGLARSMMDRLETHTLSKGQVNFYDQSINGNLALSSSKDGSYVTLDMKEASDRVSMQLVEALFDEVPDLLRALQACTTSHIALPSGEQIRKNKFASMGSALCFPVMSAVHFALAVSIISIETGCRNTAIAKDVFVYGDDLIVKREHAQYLIDIFPLFGLKFNEQKCCRTGNFRESCGVDAFNGIDVTPQRVKTHAVLRKDPATLEHFLAVFHGLFNRGLWHAARVFQEEIMKQYGDLPCVSKTSGAVGWIMPRASLIDANLHRFRWNDSLQSLTLKVRLIKSVPNAFMIGNEERLLRSLVHAKEESGSLTRRNQAKIAWKRIPLSAL